MRFASAAVTLGYFVAPVEAGTGQELYPAMVDSRGHAITVQLDLVRPLRAARGRFDELELRGNEGRERNARV